MACRREHCMQGKRGKHTSKSGGRNAISWEERYPEKGHVSARMHRRFQIGRSRFTGMGASRHVAYRIRSYRKRGCPPSGLVAQLGQVVGWGEQSRKCNKKRKPNYTYGYTRPNLILTAQRCWGAVGVRFAYSYSWHLRYLHGGDRGRRARSRP
jgi:hypothetical protein